MQAPGLTREPNRRLPKPTVAKQALGRDRDARQRELTVRTGHGCCKSGGQLGLPILLALCSAILTKSLQGWPSGHWWPHHRRFFESLANAIDIAELAAEKGAQTLLAPVSCRKQLNDISDDLAAKITIQYYTDPYDALVKALTD